MSTAFGVMAARPVGNDQLRGTGGARAGAVSGRVTVTVVGRVGATAGCGTCSGHWIRTTGAPVPFWTGTSVSVRAGTVVVVVVPLSTARSTAAMYPYWPAGLVRSISSSSNCTKSPYLELRHRKGRRLTMAIVVADVEGAVRRAVRRKIQTVISPCARASAVGDNVKTLTAKIPGPMRCGLL